MNEFVQLFSETVQADELIHLVLSRPVAGQDRDLVKVSVRPVELKTGRAVQFTFHEPARETHRNLAPDAAVTQVEQLFGSGFRQADLFAVTGDIRARLKASGKLKLARRAPTRTRPSVEHNRSKKYLIPEGTPCPFLIEIGVMTEEGRVRASKYDKFRQVNRFLEFIEDLYSTLPATGVLRVIDFGCGKSYLTFAMYELLVRRHGRRVEMLGIDLKRDVIDDCRRIAGRLECDGLSFQVSDVADVEPSGPVDLVVSLHACDTATDIALAQAVSWQAGAILSVPCCHHEFASMIGGDRFRPLLQHGILRERFAELVTDAYRAQMLDACGYRTQVLEFVPLEHTARNILIRATRRDGEPHSDDARLAAEELLQPLGIHEPLLASLLGSSDPT